MLPQIETLDLSGVFTSVSFFRNRFGEIWLLQILYLCLHVSVACGILKKEKPSPKHTTSTCGHEIRNGYISTSLLFLWLSFLQISFPFFIYSSLAFLYLHCIVFEYFSEKGNKGNVRKWIYLELKWIERNMWDIFNIVLCWNKFLT